MINTNNIKEEHINEQNGHNELTRERVEQIVNQGESLSGVNLSGLNLEGLDLKGIDFSASVLSDAVLRIADLSEAILVNSEC